MPAAPAPGKYKSDTPRVVEPSVSTQRELKISRTLKLVAGVVVLIVLIVALVAARRLFHPKTAEGPSTSAAPQIEVPAPAPDPKSLLPHATESLPVIATITEMAKTWSTKEFFFRNRSTGENVPALLIRLPAASAAQSAAYWAFQKNSAYGNCHLEYVSNLRQLEKDYGFAKAKHPMVANPCSRSVFDPLKMTNLPNGAWVRGAIVQGSDLRPPLGIEIKLQGKDILAVRME